MEETIAPISELVLSPDQLLSAVEYKVAQHGEGARAEQNASLITTGASSALWRRLQSHVRNAWSLATLLPALLDADLQERALFKGIANGASDILEWVVFNFSCELKVFKDISDVTILRTLAFGCKQVFIRHDISSWTRFEKFAFIYVCGKRTLDSTLVEDAISLLTGYRMQETHISKTTQKLSDHELWEPTAETVQK